MKIVWKLEFDYCIFSNKVCGIAGIFASNNVSTELYETLLSLQHRGQDSAGIITYNGSFHVRKGLGLVREVFEEKHIERLSGSAGIGHVRYTTAGGSSVEEVQPFMVNSPFGIALAFNGNVYNFKELKEEVFKKDLRHINSNSDTEVVLNIFAYELSRYARDDFFTGIKKAIKSVHRRVKGAYSAVALVADKGVIAFRDPHGIRPLVWGRRKNGNKYDHIFASEDTSFQILGFERYRDLEPGEVVCIDKLGRVKTEVITKKEFKPCIFEYIYFARVDATLDNVSVYRARLRMGQNLAKKIKKVYPDLEIDVVIPAPQSATTAALSCAHELGVRYTEGLYKNPFIGRTFIMPEQKERQNANKYKLSAIKYEIKGKNVLILDDSIVRGNVSRHIVKLTRQNGAKKVYFASASPPLIWPDLYGIDMPTRQELIAYKKTEEEVRKEIGADILIYQDLEDVIEAVTRKGDVKFKRPHCAYFDGKYPTSDIDEKLLKQVEKQRMEERKITN